MNITTQLFLEGWDFKDNDYVDVHLLEGPNPGHFRLVS